MFEVRRCCRMQLGNASRHPWSSGVVGAATAKHLQARSPHAQRPCNDPPGDVEFFRCDTWRKG